MTDLRARYIETLKSLMLNDIYPEVEAERAYLIEVAEGGRAFEPRVFYSGAVADPAVMEAIATSHRSGRHLHGRLKFATIGASMIGRARMDNLHWAVETVLADGVPGDIVECGVWRGGAMAFAKGVLDAHGSNRAVWLADSFEGLPAPDHPEDTVDLSTPKYPMLAIPEDRVRALFQRLGLWDHRVHLLAGWFDDTLPKARIDQIAVLRLDADYYASTMTALDALYHRVPSGGVVIIDDYGVLEPAKKATDQFRADHGIAVPLINIDGAGVCWRKD